MTPEKLPEERSSDETESEMENDPVPVDLASVARQLSSRLARQSEITEDQSVVIPNDLDDEIFEDDAAALRWRHALLRLSETFLDAAEERRDLSPILLGALHNALEQLLIHGEEADLMALEDWLGHEASIPGNSSALLDDDREERRTADFLMAGENGAYNGVDRRNSGQRRSGTERRQVDRRS